jgi:hypothetical protein
MKLTAKQVRSAFENVLSETRCPITTKAVEAFLNAMSDVNDNEQMVWSEVLSIFADDVRDQTEIAAMRKR